MRKRSPQDATVCANHTSVFQRVSAVDVNHRDFLLESVRG